MTMGLDLQRSDSTWFESKIGSRQLESNQYACKIGYLFQIKNRTYIYRSNSTGHVRSDLFWIRYYMIDAI